MRLSAVLTTTVVVAGLVAAGPVAAGPVAAAPVREAGGDRLLAYARDTWRSMAAMVYDQTALPDDNIGGGLDRATRGGYTSPTNIGAYLWSTVTARDLGLVGRAEAYRRMAATLATLGRLDRHDDSGMFYNWYSPSTRAVLRVWPPDGTTVYPFLSSVDNGWLAAALTVVRNAEPRLAGAAEALLRGMDFGFFYDAAAKPDVGLVRGGFWDEPNPNCSVADNYRHRGPDVYYTCHHYDLLNSEPRIVTYLGIANGQIPARAYFGTWRTFPTGNCDFGWSEQAGIGEWRTYLGLRVFEGAYRYRGMTLVPSWGGDMFESLMPDLFVPEASWAPDSWGVNHPLVVRAQIEHGLDEAGYGYWGFSPSSNPAGGYREYGVDAIGMDSAGYPSDQERTDRDDGYVAAGGEVCRPAQPAPAEYGDGVVTPHAVFLALPYAPRQALANLDRLRRDFDSYGAGGFYDAVAVRSGTVARRYLALDQGMIMGALGNVLGGGALHRYFVRGDVEARLRPLLGMERFAAGGASGRGQR